MDVTVILCTYNRSRSLAKALASIAAQVLPNTVEWEVLVVDNNSRDDTPAVVADFHRGYPNRFRYLFEPQPGKSHALNAGIYEAYGNILAFTDDDVIVEPSWLENLTAALRNGYWAGVGGRILPQWNGTLPKWLPRSGQYALAPLAAFDLGLQPAPLREAPFGANMAYRKAVLEKYGGFRTDLGPRPGSEIRNEDTEFGLRLLAAGEKLYYEPAALIYHAAPRHRIQKQYFLTWWFDKARADILQHGIPPTKWRVAGVPIYLFRRLCVWILRWLVTFQPSRRFACKLNVWSKVGEIIECHRQSQIEKVGIRTELT